MKRTILYILGAAALLCGCSTKQKSTSIYTQEDLVWEENFDGTELNMADWNFEFHEPGWVNNEWQSYDDSKENTYVKNGHLVIQPLKIQNPDGSYRYTSGRINTMNKHNFKYGRIEASIKMPEGQGYLPAFWMMPADESFYGQWPKCGEIDIAEILGQQPKTTYATLHYGEPHSQQQGSYTLDKGSFTTSFHTYAVEWEPSEMRFYIDNILFKTVNDWFTKKEGFGEVTYPAPYDQPFYIILNVAVGGSWPGYPDETTTFDEKAQMQVDYVRVYQKKEYNEDVKKPAEETVKITADTTGNLVKSDNSKWSFLTAGNGAGELIADKGNLTIKSTAAGSLEYSVQVVQPDMPMEKGKVYRYSFDAYADEPRTIITGITAPDYNYKRYVGDAKINVTTEKQHYEFVFDMTDKSDANGRIEYNLGCQGSLATVYVSNIRLEQIGNVDFSKYSAGVLPDGNFVHNGQFQEGEGRMEYWSVKDSSNALCSVSNTKGVREFTVSPVTKGQKSTAVLEQNIANVPANKEFKLSFDAHASSSGTVTVKFMSVSKTINLTNGSGHYEQVFTTEASGEKLSILSFTTESSDGDVMIDNVVLKENAVLLNGDFAQGMTSWEVYANENAKVAYEVKSSGSKNVFSMDISNTGDADWNIQLMQRNIKLEQGKKYRLTINASCDINRDIMWALQRDGANDDNWYPYSGTMREKATAAGKTYVTEFVMTEPTDEKTILSISLGAVNNMRISTKHNITITNVTLVEM